MFKYFLTLLTIIPSLAFAQTNTINFNKDSNLKIVQQWSKSLQKVSDVPSTTYIVNKHGGKDSMHKNKHRSVIIWIPDKTNLNKEFTLLIWFHGHWGYAPHRTFEDRTLKQLVPHVNKKNFVLALPEMPWSIHTKTPTKRNSLLWMKEGSFLKFVHQVNVILSEHNNKNKLGKIDYRIIGHSAGGSTIKRLSITKDLCRLKPSLIVWSDSTYGNWLEKAWHGCLKDTNIKIKIFVKKFGSPHLRAKTFLAKIKPNKNLSFYIKDKGWSHKKIGNKIVELSNVL